MNFHGTPGEQVPFAGVIRDSAGNLYGTTYNGGAFGSNGTVYELNKSGAQTFLFSFNQFDGGEPTRVWSVTSRKPLRHHHVGRCK